VLQLGLTDIQISTTTVFSGANV